MSPVAQKLTEDVLALPDDDRAALIEVLLRSLEPPSVEKFDRLWAEEAERRVKEIEAGTVTLVDGEEVLNRPKLRLEPLPVLEGRVPEGWKDAIYDDPH